MVNSSHRLTRFDLLGSLTLLTLPWALIAINRSWILTSSGTSDGWVYYGYFTNLREFLRAFPGIYNGTRLAWILPGALVHQFLPPMAANYVLHVGVYYVAIFALYYTLGRAAGRRTALLVSIVTGCYSYFLHAVGWHYVDGAGLAYYSVALASLTAAVDVRRRWLALFGAGAAYAGAVHSNIVWGLMLPALTYFYVGTSRASATGRDGKLTATGGRPLVDGVHALLGFTAVTLLLGVMAVAHGGTLWFFAPTITRGIQVMQRTKAYQLDWSTWVAAVRFLAVPSLVLLSTLYVHAARGPSVTALDRVFGNHLLAMCAVLVAADLAGRTLLQNAYYWSYLIPGTALAVGVLIRSWLTRFTPGEFAGIVAVTLAAFTLPLAPAIGSRLAHTPALPMASFVALAGAALWLRRSSSMAAVSVFLLCSGMVNVITVDGTWEFKDLQRRENEYRATVAAAGSLRLLDPSAAARFWYKADAPLGSVFQAIASTRLWGYRLLGTRFPSLWNPLTEQDAIIDQGQSLVLLTSDGEALAEADRVLRARGLSATLIGDRDITEGDIRLTLLFLRADFDRRRLAAVPLMVPVNAFADGGQRLHAARVSVDRGQDLIAITTKRGTYDEQIASRPIPMTSGRRYRVEFEVRIPSGGAGLHVLATKTRAILGSKFWCTPMVNATPQALEFETGANDDSVFLLITNCGHPEPVVSDFAVRRIQIWPYR